MNLREIHERMQKLFEKALRREKLNREELITLYKNSPTADLMFIAHEIRNRLSNSHMVTWIVDRNVNITNVCTSGCKFCNFYRKPGHSENYITSISEYTEKIKELFDNNGDQLLLQGGLHPELDLSYYCDLFSTLKSYFPALKIHGLSPPEIVYLSKMEGKTIHEILTSLIASGLDSLPGGGAEILCDRVRQKLSPRKATAKEWLDVMREAHQLGMVTTATMMFGHMETKEERIDHLLAIRGVQNEKPSKSPGFTTFIPWPFQDKYTEMKRSMNISANITPEEYIRTIALSRIALPNIRNIQASWLTVGRNTAQLSLFAGANDLGSIMLEENVVSSAGASHTMSANKIEKAIQDAGFIPQMRDKNFYTSLE